MIFDLSCRLLVSCLLRLPECLECTINPNLYTERDVSEMISGQWKSFLLFSHFFYGYLCHLSQLTSLAVRLSVPTVPPVLII